jgi:hypothetical protein
MVKLSSHRYCWLTIDGLRTHAAWMWLILDIILILLNLPPTIHLSSLKVIIRIRSLRMGSYLLEIRFNLLIILRNIPISLSHHVRMIRRVLLIHTSIYPHLGMILYWNLLCRILILSWRDRYELWSI